MRYKTYIWVWLGLLLLTALTLSLAGRGWGSINMLLVLGIASLKSCLIATYFMHLRDEKGIGWLRGMILGVIVLLAVLIGLTFLDVAYR